ncbi:hypothetical protein KBI23_13675 [bacterium]|nr:hypothetical protein [bacterium]
MQKSKLIVVLLTALLGVSLGIFSLGSFCIFGLTGSWSFLCYFIAAISIIVFALIPRITHSSNLKIPPFCSFSDVFVALIISYALVGFIIIGASPIIWKTGNYYFAESTYNFGSKMFGRKIGSLSCGFQILDDENAISLALLKVYGKESSEYKAFLSRVNGSTGI